LRYFFVGGSRESDLEGMREVLLARIREKTRGSR
jgi:hypothetical protein